MPRGWWLIWALFSWCLQRLAEAGEPQGSKTTLYCNNTGPCEQCTDGLKAQWAYCNKTGYFRPTSCVPLPLAPYEFKLTIPLQGAPGLPNGSACLPATHLLLREGPKYGQEGMTVAAFEALMIGLMIVSMGVVWWRKKRGH